MVLPVAGDLLVRLLKVAIPLPTMGMSCAMARAEVRFAAARRDGRGKKWSRCARNTERVENASCESESQSLRHAWPSAVRHQDSEDHARLPGEEAGEAGLCAQVGEGCNLHPAALQVTANELAARCHVLTQRTAAAGARSRA
eukprot:3438844-Rhodomonas_salina.3